MVRTTNLQNGLPAILAKTGGIPCLAPKADQNTAAGGAPGTVPAVPSGPQSYATNV